MEEKTQEVKKTENKVSLWVCITIIIFFAGSFIFELIVWGTPNVHMTLIFSSAFAVILLLTQGVKMSTVEEGVIHGTKIATISMMILMLVGVMIPAWTGSGTIPVLIYYGLKVISPSIFLLACVVICALACLCTGTSWGTIATFGVAMMGIGHGLGVPEAWTAGAVISGSLFGDTMTPVSDFANLASGSCEVDLFKHIKGMFCITVPSLVISLAAALVMGLKFSSNTYDASSVDTIMSGIEVNFNISPLYAIISMVPVAIILILSIKKVNAMCVMVVSSIAAMLIAVIFQGYSLQDMVSFMNDGFSIDTGYESLDTIFNRGGLQSMMYTVSIGYLGLSFAGILEKSGVMDTLLHCVSGVTRNIRNLVLTQAATGCIVALISASDYVSVLVQGRMFAKGYDELGISRTVLSRTCLSCGAVFGWLFPWTVGGAYVSGALGLSPTSYGMFAFYIFLILIINIIYAVFGIFLPKASKEEVEMRDSLEKI